VEFDGLLPDVVMARRRLMREKVVPLSQELNGNDAKGYYDLAQIPTEYEREGWKLPYFVRFSKIEPSTRLQ